MKFEPNKCWICKRTKDDIREELQNDPSELGEEEWFMNMGFIWTLPICAGCRDLIESITFDLHYITETELKETLETLEFEVKIR